MRQLTIIIVLSCARMGKEALREPMKGGNSLRRQVPTGVLGPSGKNFVHQLHLANLELQAKQFQGQPQCPVAADKSPKVHVWPPIEAVVVMEQEPCITQTLFL